MYSVIVFDWDGTLCDTKSSMAASVQEAFRVSSFEPPTDDAIKAVAGKEIGDTMRRLKEGLTDAQVTNLVRDFYAHYNKLQETFTLFDGVREMLEQLLAKGYQLAIATNKGQEVLDRELEVCGARKFFRMFQCITDHCPAKPDPAMLVNVMHELKVDSTKVLMVGDSSADLKCAKNAQVRGLGVYYDEEGRDKLSTYECLPSIKKLPQWLQQQKQSVITPCVSSTYKVIVFDWDGTLVDSNAAIIERTKYAFRALNLEPPADDIIRRFNGAAIHDTIRQLKPDVAETQVDQFAQEFSKAKQSLNMHMGLFEGVREVLEQLQQNGYQLAIATNKGQKGLESELEVCGIKKFFGTYRYICQPDFPPKPDPSMLKSIIEHFQVKPEEVLMVGDSPVDMKFAAAADVKAVAVHYNPDQEKEFLEYCSEDCLLSSMSALLTWLQRRLEQSASPRFTL